MQLWHRGSSLLIETPTESCLILPGCADKARAMTYELIVGDRTFSSWSLRGWLMLETFGLPNRVQTVGLYSGTLAEDLAPVTPARLVPALRLPDGTVVGETFAMAETLAERHPDLAMWPREEAARATARWLVAEMCSGYSALRSACPMQLLCVWDGFEPDSAVTADLARIETMWAHAGGFGKGDWLFGEWTLADVFFAPVAARIIGYNLPVSDAARAYCMRVIGTPSFQAWRQEGLKVCYDPVPYSMKLNQLPWPS